MALQSLRSRLVVGSLLWTTGVLAIAVAIATQVIHRVPHWASVAHNAMLGAIAGACAVAGFTQLRRGLSPFDRLRAQLSAVRSGQAAHVEGAYPTEVQPLVSDLNALIDERERRVMRALAQAGDLAHGLKTPLAVIAQEAACAGAGGQTDLASAIGEQIDRMRRQMDYHLMRARSAASGASPGARCAVTASAEALTRALLKLHADRGVRIDLYVLPEHVVRVRREDVDEMLGNLLDNACKWAASLVTLTTSTSLMPGTGAAAIAITVDDDGPGIPAEMLESVLQRGVRADQAAAGSGFGLAIVRDLVELHGGSVVLGRAPGGGARARLVLPSPAP